MSVKGKPSAELQLPECAITLQVNGVKHDVQVAPQITLAELLRTKLQLPGTKIGCEAGDCGACTVLLNDRQVCSCLVPAGQCSGVTVVTVEGHSSNPVLQQLQASFVTHGAAQCGICTPGMLMSACELLTRTNSVSRDDIEHAIGGTLCRCTGYIKIIDAIADAAVKLATSSNLAAGADQNDIEIAPMALANEPAVGASVPRVDAWAKVTGTELYGGDTAPENALWMRVVRSPHAHAHFELGNLEAVVTKTPGLQYIFQASDVPGHNGFGIYPDIKDQPVLADGLVRHRGEAILALVGEQSALESLVLSDLPILWKPLPALETMEAATQHDAALLHDDRLGNILIRGRVEKGDPAVLLQQDLVTVSGAWKTAFVEHAYIEPEAGYARRVGDRIEVFASTQAPQMDLDEVANVLGIEKAAVRIIPSACGGGFGGKLDVSVQPLLAVAAWLTKQPVRVVFNRVESMCSSTKRHPANIEVTASASIDGKLQAFKLIGDFNTGSYASWGPTVAGRVPVHCCGPYRVDNVHCETRAIHTHCPPSGAFRGFGTPQAALARELVYDEVAEKCGLDRLEFRAINAFKAGDITPSGQQLDDSCGMAECLDALRTDWQQMLQEVKQFNQENTRWRRGAGVACMWYGCGNTGLSNPSSMRVELTAAGNIIFYNGAVDIGQGSSTVLLQICADALGLPVDQIEQVLGDTDLTEDAGKTSASRQTFVSGKAAELAGLDLRRKLLTLMGADPSAVLSLSAGVLTSTLAEQVVSKHLGTFETLDNALGDPVVAEGFGRFDPPITALDEKGQGSAYATYAFAAQICTVDIDTHLGVIKPQRFVAAHDVGRAINPQLVEGQIHGGIVQGLGMALMEEYLPGKTENLHDYLIPTAGDVPEIDIKIIECPEPLGPYGAKGVGEPALVPTPAAILSAIRHATGVTVRQIPVLPHRMYQALQEHALQEPVVSPNSASPGNTEPPGAL